MLNSMVENIVFVSCFSSVESVYSPLLAMCLSWNQAKVHLLMQKGCLMKCFKIGMILF